MRFWNGNRWVKLQGVSAGKDCMTALQSILRNTGDGKKGILWALEPPQKKTQEKHEATKEKLESLEKL